MRGHDTVIITTCTGQMIWLQTAKELNIWVNICSRIRSVLTKKIIKNPGLYRSAVFRDIVIEAHSRDLSGVLEDTRYGDDTALRGLQQALNASKQLI